MGDGRWEMAFVPLQAQKVNPTAATDQGAEKKRTRLANTLTHHPSSSARRPADQPGRATGEWEPNQLQTALFPCVAWVVLGSLLAPPPPQFQCSPTGAMDWATGHRRDSGGQALLGVGSGSAAAAAVVGSVHPWWL